MKRYLEREADEERQRGERQRDEERQREERQREETESLELNIERTRERER